MSVMDVSTGEISNSLLCGVRCGRPPGAAVPLWLVWTARAVRRGGGAAAGLRVFHDIQQTTFEDITVKDSLIFYYVQRHVYFKPI